MTRQTISLVSFVAWVLVIGSAVHGHQRQLYLPNVSLGCVTGFFSLEPTQQQCLFGFGDSISINGSSINIELSPPELDRACGVAGCRIGLTKLIEACETEIRNGLQIPAVVNLVALLDLLCVKDTSDSYCFYQLERPLLENDNDPVVLCSSALSGGGCTSSCKSVLSNYISSCCLVTYFFLNAGNNTNQIMIGTSGLWQSCGLTAPDTCQGYNTNIGPRPTPAALGGDSDGGSDGRIIAGAVIGALIVTALLVLVVLLLVFLVYRYRAGGPRYPVGSVKFTDERVEQRMDVTLTAHEVTEANHS